MKILFFITLALLACTPPPAPAAPASSGDAVRVAVVDGLDWTAWRDDQRAAISAYLPTLSRVGVQWTIARESDADVLVRSWDAGEGCLDGAARYVVGWRYVEVDAACVGGLDGLRFAVAHELLHWLTHTHSRWIGHVCKLGNEASDCHPTVRGRSLLNPVLYESPGETLGDLLIDSAPTDTDRALLRALNITR